MVNEIHVRVGFKDYTLVKKDAIAVEGDYNTTKLVFEFEDDVTNKQLKFGMTNPDGELVMFTDILNNEIILATEDDKGNVCSVFRKAGMYTFHAYLIGENGESQRTSPPGYLPVLETQVNASLNVNVPFFLTLLRQIDNMDISAVQNGTQFEIMITHKDGTKTVVSIPLDDALDLYSENAIQNRVVAKAIQEIKSAAFGVEAHFGRGAVTIEVSKSSAYYIAVLSITLPEYKRLDASTTGLEGLVPVNTYTHPSRLYIDQKTVYQYPALEHLCNFLDQGIVVDMSRVSEATGIIVMRMSEAKEIIESLGGTLTTTINCGVLSRDAVNTRFSYNISFSTAGSNRQEIYEAFCSEYLDILKDGYIGFISNHTYIPEAEQINSEVILYD